MEPIHHGAGPTYDESPSSDVPGECDGDPAVLTQTLSPAGLTMLDGASSEPTPYQGLLLRRNSRKRSNLHGPSPGWAALLGGSGRLGFELESDPMRRRKTSMCNSPMIFSSRTRNISTPNYLIDWTRRRPVRSRRWKSDVHSYGVVYRPDHKSTLGLIFHL